jgi:adenylyltransferase/sulfurtransferase
VLEISVEELKDELDRGEPVHLLDVREPAELEICRLDGAEHIPMLELFAGLRSPAAEPGARVVVFCHVGERSLEAAKFLRRHGFASARSLAGGIDAWAARFDPSMARY